MGDRGAIFGHNKDITRIKQFYFVNQFSEFSQADIVKDGTEELTCCTVFDWRCDGNQNFAAGGIGVRCGNHQLTGIFGVFIPRTNTWVPSRARVPTRVVIDIRTVFL
ncbi:Uncharacterised protein [Vibrio cholerae]|uniref:Uncharacterized protein n=1 Tax=Vibrio cholerae TaxID=666 RepID=A0A655XAT0_VIBCL|nr:Uncharacterised protein [Vibrio cholerae]CSC40326.1 Uncharacterised protein [Vibrio cholerae]